MTALTSRINGSFRSRSFVLAWYCLISRSATVPGRYRRFCLVGSGSPAGLMVSKIVVLRTWELNAHAVCRLVWHDIVVWALPLIGEEPL